MVARRRARGMSLQLVLGTVCTLCFIAAAMVALFTTNLNLTMGYANGNIAQDEAEAGISQAMAELTADPAWGTHGEEVVGCASGPDAPQTGHVVTFSSASDWPYSTNNQSGDAQSGFHGRTVPSGVVHLISTGWCRGQVRTVEAIVSQPPFPYAVAVSGPLESTGSLVIEGAQTSGSYVSGSADRPGDLAANSSKGVTITQSGGSQTYVAGYVTSCGPIRIQPPSVVRAGVRPHAGAVVLPHLEVAGYDNRGQKGVIALQQGSYGATTLKGAYAADQSLTYSDALTLDNAFLYVNGNLTLTNGVTGTGALVVNGSITMKGGPSQIVGSQNVALIATGPITVAGTPSGKGIPALGNGNVFQGLVYSQASIDARNILVVGNLVVDAPPDKSGGCTLQNVHVVGTRDAATIRFKVELPPDPEESPEPVRLKTAALGSFSTDASGNTTFDAYRYQYDSEGHPLPPQPAPGQTLYLGTPPAETFGSGPDNTGNAQQAFGASSESTAQTANDSSSAPSTSGTQPSATPPPAPTSWQALLAAMPPGSIAIGDLGLDTSTSQGTAIQGAVRDLTRAQEAALADPGSPQAQSAFTEAKKNLADVLSGANASSASSNGGSSSSSGSGVPYDFSLNTFLPTNGGLRVTCWHLVNHRL